MEIFFALAAMAVTIFILVKLSSRDTHSPPPDQSWQRERRRPNPPAPKRPSRDRTPTPAGARHERSEAAPRFDAETAHLTVQPRQLEGRAYVVDGDTIRIQKTQIRLFGVDAPEMNHPFGRKAKSAMFELCKGQIITAEITAMDDHGRTVAKCFLPDGRDLSAEMVKQGMAIDWPKYSGGIYRAMETPDARKKLWLADARQKGRMHVWEAFDARERAKASNGSK